MNRRELLRNSLLTFGAMALNRPAGARVFTPGEDVLADLESPNWHPIFFNVHQNETLIALSDAIIPTTDTAGAKTALVNRFLDLVLSVEPTAGQQQFVSALTWFDAGATERYKTNFVDLTEEEKKDLLNLVAWPHTHARWGESEASFPGYQNFSLLKRWIVSAYYSSPIGLKEQGWDGWAARGTFSGCEHQPDGHKNS